MDILTIIGMLGAIASILNGIAEIIKAISQMIDSINAFNHQKKRKPQRFQRRGKR